MSNANVNPDPLNIGPSPAGQQYPLYRASGLPEPLENDPSVLMGIGFGLLRRGGSLLICGETGIGKSILALMMAIRLVLGLDFLGIPVRRRMRVLFLSASCEDSPEVLWAHLHGLMEAMHLDAEQRARVEEDLVICPVNRGEASLEWAAHAAKAIKADVVVLNPLQHFSDSHPSEVTGGFRLVSKLAELLERTQVALIAIHHFTRSSHQGERGESWSRAHYSGAGVSSLFDFFRAGAMLKGVGSTRGQALFKLTKGADRSGLALEDLRIEWVKGETVRPGQAPIKHLGWVAAPVGSPEGKPEADELLKSVQGLIKAAGAPLALSDLRSALEKGGRKLGESTLSRHVGRWVKEGMLAGEQQGKRIVYGLPPDDLASSGEVES